MIDSRSFIASVSMLAIASCGASSNSAPVVYGTEPATGRIYNSPAEVYLEQQGGQYPTGQGPTSLQQTGGSVQAQNAPLYQAQDQRQGVRIYNAPPSATSAQVPIRNVPAQQTPINQAPVQRVPVSGGPVALDPYGQVVTAQPEYRGLPPSPTYRSAPQQLIATPVNNGPLVGGGTVIVQPGDTIYAISRRTGISPQDIINVNRMAPPYALSVGQTILLPTSSVGNAVIQNDPYRAPITTDVSRQIAYNPTPAPAPAISREVIARDVLYTVSPGDTLYSIARRNAISVQSITSANRIGAPYTLSVGQQLLLPAVPTGQAASVYQPGAPSIAQPVTTRAATPAPAQGLDRLTREVSYSKTTPVNPANQFQWPVKGSVISNFGAGGIGRRNDGINISAPQGTTIRAASAGEVVYRGSELDGYGNLLLIKHDGGYVTAYAHNDVMLVRKGQKVKKGQIIGKVGKTGAVTEPQLHFEIRQNLKSVDPLQFLASN